MKRNLKLKKMGAPEGNQFWKLRAKHGREAIFQDPEKLWECSLDYFKWCDDHPYYRSEQKKGNTIIPKNAEYSSENMKDIVNPIAEIPIARPYTIQGVSLYLGVHSKYFYDFEDSLKIMEDREKAKDFSEIVSRIREIISGQKLSGAMIGIYNPMIVARIEGLKEKTDITTNDKEIQTVTISREDYQALSKNINTEV